MSSILSPSLPSFFKSGKQEVEELTYAEPVLHWDPPQSLAESSYGPYRAGFSWLPPTPRRNELWLIDAENEFRA